MLRMRPHLSITILVIERNVMPMACHPAIDGKVFVLSSRYFSTPTERSNTGVQAGFRYLPAYQRPSSWAVARTRCVSRPQRRLAGRRCNQRMRCDAWAIRARTSSLAAAIAVNQRTPAACGAAASISVAVECR